MPFGSVDKSIPSIDRSIKDMQNEKPIFEGAGKNTYINKDGDYYFMNRKVTKEEYDLGMDQYESILNAEIERKKAELN